MTQIVIAGASGLIGQQAANLLVKGGAQVTALLRKHSDNLEPAVIQHVGPGDQWPAMVEDIGPDIAISCLGTTMRIAGSQAAFRSVDHDLVFAFAKAARMAGAKHFIAVSSVGASAKSGSFYLRTKGEIEGLLEAMAFDRLDFIRPGLLTGGSRPDIRLGESIATLFSPVTDLFLLGEFSRFRSTPAAKVAQAIAALVVDGGQGNFIHENDSINALAG